MTSQLRRLLALSFIVFVVTATSTFAQRNRPHDEANPRGYAPNRISDGERSSKPSPPTPAHDEANPRGYAPNRISDGEKGSRRSAPTPAHDEANPRGYAPNRISDGERGERQSTISPPHDESNPRAYGGQNSSPSLNRRWERRSSPLLHNEANPRSYGHVHTGPSGHTVALSPSGRLDVHRSSNVRLITLPSGDMIPLPVRDIWQGDAQISVDMKVFRGQMQYLVSITANGGNKSIRERVREVIEEKGLGYAVRHGLARVVGRVGGGVVVQTLEPSPLANDVVMRTMSMFNGMVEVHIVNSR